MSGRFATLTFERQVAASAETLWQAWTAPAARAIWAAPSPSGTMEFLEADTRVGGREVSLCKVEGQTAIRCECGWLELQPTLRSVTCEVISSVSTGTEKSPPIGVRPCSDTNYRIRSTGSDDGLVQVEPSQPTGASSVTWL